MRSKIRIGSLTALLVAALCARPAPAAAATDSLVAPSSVRSDSLEWIARVLPNSGDENYLRYLQLTGTVAEYPWSLRSSSGFDSKRLAMRVGTHPWSQSEPLISTDRRASVLPLSADVRFNAAFPYGSNDGAVWAGRGATGSFRGGIMASAGPFRLELEPIAFVAQNLHFELLNNNSPGAKRFGDGLYQGAIDRPQRFGNKPYARVDFGNSSLSVNAATVTAGISTANMAWGPMELYPFVLGTNAPGFLHAYIGSSRPINVWVARLHARLVWGRLEQSEYSPITGNVKYETPDTPGMRRFASGLVMAVQPRGMPGLELGLARFFHSPWPRTGIPASYFTKPFEGLLKRGLTGSPDFGDPGTTADNQLISGFARWVFPAAGIEMYAEYGREDHSWDKRDFAQEPDHSRSYALGLRKTFRVRPQRMSGITFELINFQLPHLARTGRFEGGIYAHGVMRQGHTHRGQLLGADVGVGAAAGATARWDTYTPKGRTTYLFQRVVRQDKGSFFTTGEIDERSSDVQYSVEVERLKRVGLVEVTGGVALIHEFNRNFKGDATSASARLGARVPLFR